jgi:hypothetical protein
MPSSLSAGWHSLTWTGTGAQGNTVMTTLWFEVSETRVLLKTSSVEPVIPSTTPVAAPTPQGSGGVLALTGPSFVTGGIVSTLGLLVAGLALLTHSRRSRFPNKR